MNAVARRKFKKRTPQPLRIALFGSFRRGEALLLRAIELKRQYPGRIELCLIATDNPNGVKMSPRRIWRYVGDKIGERNMLARLANENNIPFWDGSVRGDDFREAFDKWKPDICYMGTFGQKVPAEIFKRPRLGFFNFHPCMDGLWPSCVGGDPFEQLLAAKVPYCAVAMHQVNEQWDHGDLVSFSRPFVIAPNDTPVTLHSKTAVAAAEMMHWHVLRQLKLLHRPMREFFPYPRLSSIMNNNARPA